MPIKRRIRKRRLDERAEIEAWSSLFTVGYDYFGDLDPLGFPGGDADTAALAAAPKAWKRLGRAFLETIWATRDKLDRGRRETPWAVEQFGYPRGWRVDEAG